VYAKASPVSYTDPSGYFPYSYNPYVNPWDALRYTVGECTPTAVAVGSLLAGGISKLAIKGSYKLALGLQAELAVGAVEHHVC
jgi:hypothetical protein